MLRYYLHTWISFQKIMTETFVLKVYFWAYFSLAFSSGIRFSFPQTRFSRLVWPGEWKENIIFWNNVLLWTKRSLAPYQNFHTILEAIMQILQAYQNNGLFAEINWLSQFSSRNVDAETGWWVLFFYNSPHFIES